MNLRRVFFTAALVVAAGCGGGRATPREALESLRGALSAHDGAALDALTDSESVAHRRAEVRERRAMLERGDDPGATMQGMPLSAGDIRRGTEADAAALLLERRSPLFDEAKWFNAAAVVEETAEGDDAARIKLRGVDGVERELWFVRQGGRWCYDQFRTRRTWN